MYSIDLNIDPMLLTENSQVTKIRFASIDINGEKIKTRHPFVKCRDYFNEIIVGSHIRYSYCIVYGFTLDTENFPINLNRTELLLEANDKSRKNLIDNWYLLNGFEEENGFRLSSITPIKKEGETYLLILGDKGWIENM